MRYNLRRPDGAPFDLNLTKLGGGGYSTSLQIQQFRKWYFDNRWAFISIFCKICTAHAQKLLFYFCCLAGKARIRPNTIVSKLIADNQYDARITWHVAHQRHTQPVVTRAHFRHSSHQRHNVDHVCHGDIDSLSIFPLAGVHAHHSSDIAITVSKTVRSGRVENYPFRGQGRSDWGISVYVPPKSVYVKFYVAVLLLWPRKLRYRTTVRLSSATVYQART